MKMKGVSVLFLFAPMCWAMPRFSRQAGMGGIDPAYGPGFGDPNSPFNGGNLMARNGMDPMFGSSFNRGQGQWILFTFTWRIFTLAQSNKLI